MLDRGDVKIADRLLDTIRSNSDPVRREVSGQKGVKRSACLTKNARVRDRAGASSLRGAAGAARYCR